MCEQEPPFRTLSKQKGLSALHTSTHAITLHLYRAGILLVIQMDSKHEAKVLLAKIGWTQAALARQIEETPSKVSNWFTGRVKMPLVVLRYLRCRSKLAADV